MVSTILTPMDVILKWIGGTTLAVALVLAGVAIGGSAIAEDRAPARASRSIPRIAPELATQPAITPAPANERDNAFRIKRILPISEPIKYGQWFWDDAGVPPGPLVITIDLEARVISVFRGGYEIGAAAAMLGTKEHPTPTGTFPVLSKERHNVSEKYYDSPMPWTLRLTWDGVAIHGGNEVENGYASHGCIAIPDELAAKLFEVARKGDLVVITDGEQLSVGDSII